jgi:hypothetical protein
MIDNTANPAAGADRPAVASNARRLARVTTAFDVAYCLARLAVFHSLRLPLYAARLLYRTFHTAA